MNEMIERVARAICKAYSGRECEDWTVFAREAIAAIDAMPSDLYRFRDPTEGMISAGLRVDLGNEDERASVINLWHAMIDEALK